MDAWVSDLRSETLESSFGEQGEPSMTRFCDYSCFFTYYPIPKSFRLDREGSSEDLNFERSERKGKKEQDRDHPLID